jgi:hypothetical protein
MWEVLPENERLSTKQQIGQVFTCMKRAILLRKNKPNFRHHQMCVHLQTQTAWLDRMDEASEKLGWMWKVLSEDGHLNTRRKLGQRSLHT